MQETSGPDTERWVFGLAFVGLTLSLVGDILEYWGGPGEGFTQTQIKGYSIEILGLLLVLWGSVSFGVIYRGANVLPRFLALLLIAAGSGDSYCPSCTSQAERCSCSAVPGRF